MPSIEDQKLFQDKGYVMAYKDWLHGVEPRRTPKGARLDLRIYVYPDGHGNILVGPNDQFGAPVNNEEEAVQVIRDLWQMATRVHEVTGDPENVGDSDE